MELLEGAKMLADLLEKRHGTEMQVRATGPVWAIGALPLFYWQPPPPDWLDAHSAQP